MVETLSIIAAIAMAVSTGALLLLTPATDRLQPDPRCSQRLRDRQIPRLILDVRDCWRGIRFGARDRARPIASFKAGSPGIIVGDDTRTSVRPGRSEPRDPYAATTLARPWEGPRPTHDKTAQRGERVEQAAPRHATTPSTRAAIPTPQRRPTGESSP